MAISSQLVPQIGPLLRAAGFEHGFFGRIGGYSQGSYESLNCSFSVGDEPSCVSENLERIAGHFGLPIERLVTVSQVHGSRVIDVSDEAASARIQKLEADALVSACGNVALGIRTADCVPVLVGCRATGAAAAIHAGWRGLVAGVIPNAIARLIAMGSKAETIVAAIGPHIGVGAFEVSEDVAARLAEVGSTNDAVAWDLGPRPHVHLGRLAISQLKTAGLRPEQIDLLEQCTYSEPNNFFSFRRDGAQSGRQLSVIRPRPSGSSATSRTID